MDYHAPTCSRCSYRLPVTWTDPDEMRLVLECVGWRLDPAVCPECRRKLWRQRERENRREAFVKLWIRDRDGLQVSNHLSDLRGSN